MGKYNVFCIDDDYPTNVYNEIIITESNLFESYRIFDNAVDALNVLTTQANTPDLLLVDINMPKMDGWTFIEALDTQVKCNGHLYVIFMLTTSLSPLDENRSKEYMCVKGIMEKPLTEEKLQTVLKKVQES